MKTHPLLTRSRATALVTALALAFGPGGTRFRGQATAVEADRGALDNLLNIIGRRSGNHSVISIG